MVMAMLHPIVVGIIAGVVRAFFGWAKSGEKWSWTKFCRTMLIFAITGGIIGIYITDPAKVFAMSFVGVPIEDFLNGIYKSFK